ncbi:MAG TPA: hypothetical protein VFZ13_12285 [Gemmatimonadales bacterium]
MTRPGVTLAVGATYDEHRVGIGNEHQRHRGPEQAGLIGNDRQGRTEAAREKAIGCQWEWERQPPPQHPPAAGAGAGVWPTGAEAAGRAVRDMSRSTAPLPQVQVTVAVPRTSRSKRLPQDVQ